MVLQKDADKMQRIVFAYFGSKFKIHRISGKVTMFGFRKPSSLCARSRSTGSAATPAMSYPELAHWYLWDGELPLEKRSPYVQRT